VSSDTLYTRKRLDEVERLLMNEEFERSAQILRQLRLEHPRRPGKPDLFDRLLASEPTQDYLLYVRSIAYRKAGLLEDGVLDLIRATLVTRSKEGCLAQLDELAQIENVELAPWMSKAVTAVAARTRQDRKAERQALLEAIRGAPEEIALFGALARCEVGSGSDIEIFALRQCVRCAPFWKCARLELHRAAKATGYPGAFAIEQLPYRPTPQARRLPKEDRSPSGRHRSVA